MRKDSPVMQAATYALQYYRARNLAESEQRCSTKAALRFLDGQSDDVIAASWLEDVPADIIATEFGAKMAEEVQMLCLAD